MKKLHFQENALLIKHIKEAPAHSDVTHSQHEGTRRFGHQLRQAAKERLVGIRKADEMLRQIDRDGIHADHPEEERPPTMVLHIDDVIEQGKEQRRDSAHEAYE